MQAIASRPTSAWKVVRLTLGLVLALALALVLLVQVAQSPMLGSRHSSAVATGAPGVAAGAAGHQAAERADAAQGAGLAAAIHNHQASERSEAGR